MKLWKMIRMRCNVYSIPEVKWLNFEVFFLLFHSFFPFSTLFKSFLLPPLQLLLINDRRQDYIKLYKTLSNYVYMFVKFSSYQTVSCYPPKHFSTYSLVESKVSFYFNNIISIPRSLCSLIRIIVNFLELTSPPHLAPLRSSIQNQTNIGPYPQMTTGLSLYSWFLLLLWRLRYLFVPHSHSISVSTSLQH